mmetsp:Transcript_15077/g.17855  ORF Transcript_15077/g.17855 Transcript_15077/m.17855 type:complete len:100 (-) Transcript_15077:349-648(-)
MPTANFDTPKFDTPKRSSDNSAPKDLNLESQDVRDERARVLASEFNKLENDAKAKSKVARAARKEAQAAKKLADAAKGEACKTRIGGKVACIRPFGVGY